MFSVSSIGPAAAHPVEHVGPALEGDALEDCQHRLTEVVKAGEENFQLRPGSK